MGSRKTVDRLLCVIATVKPGEGLTALLLAANLFLLMTAYYIIKPVREALILGGAGPEIKSYAGGVGALLFLLVVPLYGKASSRLDRLRLINGVTAFFALNLLMFHILSRLQVSFGVVFFLWTGLFNLMLVAQFWSFANDIYTQEQGKRLFAVVGIGSSLGAIFGAQVARWLFAPIGAGGMMLIAAGLLFLCIVITSCIDGRETSCPNSRESSRPLQEDGGFQLVFKQPYLLLIATLILLSNVVNTTGEFILGKSVAEYAATVVSASPGASPQEYIGRFYADFYFWVNLISAALQIFAVSRVMRRVGIGPALLFLPLISLGGYTLLSLFPFVGLIRVVKIAENGTDYSLQNTARHALFLRTSREAKYKGKTAIDGFFWRTGDAFSGAIIFLGTHLALDLRGFAWTNTILAVAWLSVAGSIVWLRMRHGEVEFEDAGVGDRSVRPAA